MYTYTGRYWRFEIDPFPPREGDAVTIRWKHFAETPRGQARVVLKRVGGEEILLGGETEGSKTLTLKEGSYILRAYFEWEHRGEVYEYHEDELKFSVLSREMGADWDVSLDKGTAMTGEKYNVIVRINSLRGVADADYLKVVVKPNGEAYYTDPLPVQPQTVKVGPLEVKDFYCGYKRPCDLPITVELWAHFPQKVNGAHSWLLGTKQVTLRITEEIVKSWDVVPITVGTPGGAVKLRVTVEGTAQKYKVSVDAFGQHYESRETSSSEFVVEVPVPKDVSSGVYDMKVTLYAYRP